MGRRKDSLADAVIRLPWWGGMVLAGLVVLEHNLFEVDPMTLKDVQVSMTLLNGELVYALRPLAP